MALEQAAAKGNVSEMRKLLDGGADVNEKEPFSGYTPLHWATDNGHSDAVALLLERGASVNVQNESGDTPLHVAALFGHKSIIQILVDAGANLKVKNENNQTPKELARAEKKKGAYSLLKKLEAKTKK